MTINTDSTRFYINGGSGAKGNFGVDGLEGGSKAGDSSNGGFAVSGRNGSKGTAASNLFNIDLATDAKTLNNENRVYWYPEKNAFMAGNLKVEHADSVGTNSFNAGYQNKAIGEYSQALGYQSVAKGDYTTAIGREARAEAENAYAFGNSAKAIGVGSYAIGAGAVATGISSYAFGSAGEFGADLMPAARATADYAYAFGAGTVASEVGALAMGTESWAKGKYSVTIGRCDTALGHFSIAMGYKTNAIAIASTSVGRETKTTGWYSTAMGFKTTASGNSSTSIGNETLAAGNSSTAMGKGTKAKSFCEVSIGQLNTDYELVHSNFSVTGWLPQDRLFVIGNGNVTLDTTRSDALIVYKNGNMEVNGNITYTGSCGPSDMRLKKDVRQLNGALDKVLKLRGVSFYWKSKEEMAAARGKDVNNFSYGFGSEKQIGVIAQEIEEVLPELVVTDNEGFKAVKYENLTPVLIEAVKEQQTIIEGLESKVEKLEKLVEELLKKQ